MTVMTVPSQPQAHQGRTALTATTTAQASDFQRPNVENSNGTDQTSYVLTLYTSRAHHTSMNRLRRIYFPKRLNKIPAHITLFHALPGSKLHSDILPAIEQCVQTTGPYRIRASGPKRLGKGIAIEVDDDIDHTSEGKDGRGRNMTRMIHDDLREKWKPWLSQQDSAPMRMHYTVMNKIDDKQVVSDGLELLEETFRTGKDASGGKFNTAGTKNETSRGSDHSIDLEFTGQVMGLVLWRYERGWWKEPQRYLFDQSPSC